MIKAQVTNLHLHQTVGILLSGHLMSSKSIFSFLYKTVQYVTKWIISAGSLPTWNPLFNFKNGIDRIFYVTSESQCRFGWSGPWGPPHWALSHQFENLKAPHGSYCHTVKSLKVEVMWCLRIRRSSIRHSGTWYSIWRSQFPLCHLFRWVFSHTKSVPSTGVSSNETLSLPNNYPVWKWATSNLTSHPTSFP